MNLKVYVIFKDNKIVKISHNLDEMIDYILNYPKKDRVKLSLCKKIIYQGLVSYETMNIVSYIPEKTKKELIEKEV